MDNEPQLRIWADQALEGTYGQFLTYARPDLIAYLHADTILPLIRELCAFRAMANGGVAYFVTQDYPDDWRYGVLSKHDGSDDQQIALRMKKGDAKFYEAASSIATKLAAILKEIDG